MMRRVVYLLALSAVACHRAAEPVASGPTTRAVAAKGQPTDAGSVEGTSRPPPTVTRVPIASEAVVPPIQVGPLPLVYLFNGDDRLTITDETRGTVLVTTRLRGQQIVRVDAKRGVIAGENTLVKGPLDPAHRYAIRLGAPRAGEFRNESSGRRVGGRSDSPTSEEKR